MILLVQRGKYWTIKESDSAPGCYRAIHGMHEGDIVVLSFEIRDDGLRRPVSSYFQGVIHVWIEQFGAVPMCG